MRVVDSGAGAYWVLGKEVLEAVRGYFNGNLTGRQALAIVRLSLLFRMNRLNLAGLGLFIC